MLSRDVFTSSTTATVLYQHSTGDKELLGPLQDRPRYKAEAQLPIENPSDTRRNINFGRPRNHIATVQAKSSKGARSPGLIIRKLNALTVT